MAEISVGAAGASGGQTGPKPAAAAAPAAARSRDEVRGPAEDRRPPEKAARQEPELRAVSDNTDTRLAMAANTMGAEEARQAVREDVEALRAIEPAAGRSVAMQVMGQLVEKQEQYRVELERQDVQLAAEIDAALRERRPLAAPVREAVARARERVDLELELEAEVEREGERVMDSAPARSAGGVELGARPAAVARAAAVAAVAGEGKSAADAARPGVVASPAASRPGAQASAAAEEELEEELAEEDELLRRKRAAEAAQSAVLENAVDARPSGKELATDEIIIPRRIVQSYDQVDGKFFAKDSSRMMFQDKGLTLATSGTNKETIADMVALARAKNWQSIKLTGAQEFRREAWLQAESQGVKTQGYTPKETDLAALKALTQERATNKITPVVERGQARAAAGAAAKAPEQLAPRHDLNKNQAAMHVAAMQNMAANMQALREKPGTEQRTGEELTKLAYWRGIVEEESKGDPVRQREALERFDLQTTDAEFVKRITRETQGAVNDKTVERVQKRDTHEQSL